MDQHEQHKDNGVMGAKRRLGRLTIERLVVPLVYAGHLDLDEAILLLKRGVVAALTGTGKAKALLASHISKSERWFHIHLKDIRGAQAGPAKEAPTVRSEEPLPELNSGYRFMLEVVEMLAAHYPAEATVPELRAAMDLSTWRVDDRELVARLELYAAMGLIELREGPKGAKVVRAADDLLLDLPGDDRVEKIAERMSWIPALALANFKGEGEFGGMLAELTPTALERARERLRVAFAEIMAAALAETHQTEDPTITVRAVIAMGAVGERDG